GTAETLRPALGAIGTFLVRFEESQGRARVLQVPESEPAGQKGLLVALIDAERAGFADKLEGHFGIAGTQGVVSPRLPQGPPPVRVDRLFAIGGRGEEDGPRLFVLALPAKQVGFLESKSPV